MKKILIFFSLCLSLITPLLAQSHMKGVDTTKGVIQIENKLPKFTNALIKLDTEGNNVSIITPYDLYIDRRVNLEYYMKIPKIIIQKDEAKKACEENSSLEKTSTTFERSIGLSEDIFSTTTKASQSWSISVSKATEICKEISESITQQYGNFLERDQGLSIKMSLENEYGEKILPKTSFGVIVVPVGVDIIRVSAIQPIPSINSKLKISMTHIGDTEGLISNFDNSAQLIVSRSGFKKLRFKVEYKGSKEDFENEIQAQQTVNNLFI